MDKKCHACGFKQGYIPYSLDGVNKLEDTYRCNICSHIFRHFKGDVEEYHREKYRVVGEEGHKMYPKEERLQYINNIINNCKKYFDTTYDALEIGSGDGLFAHTAQKHFKNIVCSDIDTKMTDKCAALGLDTITSSVLDISNQSYDVVFGFDVLEHVVDIQSFKDKMKEIVKKYLILQVPVNRTMVPPNPTFDGHSHYFNKHSIVCLFKDGFESLNVFYGNRGDLARGPELLCVFRRK